MPASAARELAYHGFHTIEQLAEAPDVAKSKIGTLAQFCARAKTWVEASNSDANRIVQLEASIQNERERSRRLEEKLEVLIMRINATEGTDMNYEKEVAEPVANTDKIEVEVLAAKGRRKKRG